MSAIEVTFFVVAFHIAGIILGYYIGKYERKTGR